MNNSPSNHNKPSFLENPKKNDQEFWFFFFTLVFTTVSIILGWILFRVNGELPARIPIFDAFLLVFASMRLTRLFVYDSIMAFVRNWFLIKKEHRGEGGEIYYERREPERGPKKTLRHLAKCPWCAGLWFSLLLVFFYFLTPIAWVVVLVFAIAGASTGVQILANWLGHSAQGRRMENERVKNKQER